MKRYIRSAKSRSYILPVVLELGLDDESNSIAASEDYLKRRSVSESHQLTDSQFRTLNHLIHRVVGTLILHDFKITRKAQSNKSYTYYLRFIPTDMLGNIQDINVQIQFEIRDHIKDKHPTEGMLNAQMIVKAFYVGDRECFNADGTFIRIREICDEIKCKNYSSLFIKS